MKHCYENVTEKYTDFMNMVLRQREDLQYLLNSDKSIGFIESTEKKRKNGGIVFADTRIVSGVWTAFCPYDYIITFYMPNVALLNEQQMKTLMWHELKHCGMKPDGTTCLVPHDIEDFKIILEEQGINWCENHNE